MPRCWNSVVRHQLKQYTNSVELPRASQGNLAVYDMLGREVSALLNDRKEGGVHEVKFDGSNLAGGVYFYRL
jgi:hypothetical protein